MFNSQKMLRTGACALLVALVSISNTAIAEDFRVNLIATIDDDPAMESVEWTVYKNGNDAVKKARKHSTHVKIPAGKYKVVARLTSNNKTVVRIRNFYVRSNNTQIVMPMD